ncbi:hypothetical protein F4803DRAFT_408402 [Xylaria telfairii]|nr:hypothetical protein F4803DRAFT_408402 [Xylaria telfairii]
MISMLVVGGPRNQEIRTPGYKYWPSFRTRQFPKITTSISLDPGTSISDLARLFVYLLRYIVHHAASVSSCISGMDSQRCFVLRPGQHDGGTTMVKLVHVTRLRPSGEETAQHSEVNTVRSTRRKAKRTDGRMDGLTRCQPASDALSFAKLNGHYAMARPYQVKLPSFQASYLHEVRSSIHRRLWAPVVEEGRRRDERRRQVE